jgi:hypothetical protein
MPDLNNLTALDVYRVVLFPLDADGNLSSVDENAAEGTEFIAPVSFELSLGTPRTIPVVAQGRVKNTFLMPSVDAKSGTLTCAYDSQTLNAMVTGLVQRTLGELKIMAEGTDKEGQEPLVGLLLSQLQAQNEDGLTIWRNVVIPRARLAPLNPAVNQEPLSRQYTIVASPSTKTLWHETLTLANYGCTSAAQLGIHSENKLNIVAWTGDGAEDEFMFPADKPAISNAKTSVFNFATGAIVSGTTSTPFAKWVAAAAPADGVKLACIYEYE